MASIFSIGLPKINTTGCLTRLCKISKNYNAAQVAFIKRVAYQEKRNKPAPFPYWEKPYNIYHQRNDPMVYRFDENTKLLVVDGLPAVGKTKFCEELAGELGMLYMPAPIHEEIYIHKSGFDRRTLDAELPFYARSYDLERFLENPNDGRVPLFQILFFLMRFEQHMNASLHIMSTGQGVILNRCAYSDIVFMQAMVNAGYINEPMSKRYMRYKNLCLPKLLRPNLIIYLDVPIELVKDKIKKRGRPEEANSKVFTTQYLSDLEKLYKEKYLKPISNHSHLLIYDWSKEGNLMDVIENIENTDFDDFANGKQTDWLFTTKDAVIDRRILYDQRDGAYKDLETDFPQDYPRELYLTPSECEQIEKVFQNNPAEMYEHGFNPNLGDKFLWKLPRYKRFSLRLSPRDLINQVNRE